MAFGFGSGDPVNTASQRTKCHTSQQLDRDCCGPVLHVANARPSAVSPEDFRFPSLALSGVESDHGDLGIKKKFPSVWDNSGSNPKSNVLRIHFRLLPTRTSSPPTLLKDTLLGCPLCPNRAPLPPSGSQEHRDLHVVGMETPRRRPQGCVPAIPVLPPCAARQKQSGPRTRSQWKPPTWRGRRLDGCTFRPGGHRHC